MFSTNIERVTIKNKNYRKVIYTDRFIQVVLMAIPPGETIPLESHKGSQFIRVEKGSGSVRSGTKVPKVKILKDGIAVVIPPNTKHIIKSTGKTPLKLYSIYSPPQHPRGTINRVKPKND